MLSSNNKVKFTTAIILYVYIFTMANISTGNYIYVHLSMEGLSPNTQHHRLSQPVRVHLHTLIRTQHFISRIDTRLRIIRSQST